MLTALVLVCALHTPLQDCTPQTALDAIAVPGSYMMPLECLQKGQAFFAEVYPATTYPIKIVCRRAAVNPNVG